MRGCQDFDGPFFVMTACRNAMALLFRRPETHAGASVIQEFDARPLQSRDDIIERGGSSIDFAIRLFHSAERPQSDSGLLRKFLL